MAKPNLQVALDHSSLANALGDIYKFGDIVDIIEVGTILCLQAGQEAIRCLRALYPNQIVIADTKCADAGGTVAKNCAQAGANWMTCICSATLATIQAAAKEIDEIQIELYGQWTVDQALEWRKIGIKQVIYHQSRDALLAGESWGEKDLKRLKELADMGFNVSVTGGLNVQTLSLFREIPVYTFIAGRGITSSANPRRAAIEFQDEIKKIWGD